VTSAPAFATSRDRLWARRTRRSTRRARRRCLVRIFDPAASKATLDIHASASRSAAVADVLNGGGLRRPFQPVIGPPNGEVLASEGAHAAPRGTPFRDPGVLFGGGRAAGRTYELDLACIASILNAPGRSTAVSGSASPVAAHARDARVRARAVRGPAVDGRLGAAADHHRAHRARRGPRTSTGSVTARPAASHRAGIAADDVGAGNAGLRLLIQIHFDIVKLDLALVRTVPGGEPRSDVVRSIADLAARWGAMVTRRASRTPAQLRLIRSLPIAAAQGYLPGPAGRGPRTSARSTSMPSRPASSGLPEATPMPGIGEFERLVRFPAGAGNPRSVGARALGGLRAPGPRPIRCRLQAGCYSRVPRLTPCRLRTESLPRPTSAPLPAVASAAGRVPPS